MMKFITVAWLLATCFAGYSQYKRAVSKADTIQTKKSHSMKKKILFVLTSHNKLGNTGKPTGYYLSEASHPWEILKNAGYEIDFVSPQGGKAPVDGLNLDDSANKAFWNDPAYRKKVEATMKPSEINPDDYIAIHYAGGHGTMWDFADNTTLAGIATRIYENGGIVSAVCHGPAGLVNIRLSNGHYLVDGKKVNAFTNAEEQAVKLDKVVPFSLESKLIERGARFQKAGLWQEHVVVDERLVTGQNPQSAKKVGEEVLKLLLPPVVAAPSNARPVLVTLRLSAKDADAFKNHLLKVIPITRLASGCRYSYSYQDPKMPTEFLLVQTWDSIEQQQSYIGWRQQRSDLAAFRAFLSKDPMIEFFELFDE
jgi:putative intracellular protease/amidase/quinol monooxygenase YgiN